MAAQHDVSPAEQHDEEDPDREDDDREVGRFIRRWWGAVRSGDTAACATGLRARVESSGRAWRRKRRRRRREVEWDGEDDMIESSRGDGVNVCECVYGAGLNQDGRRKRGGGREDGGEPGGEPGVFKCKGGRGDGEARTLDPVFLRHTGTAKRLFAVDNVPIGATLASS